MADQPSDRARKAAADYWEQSDAIPIPEAIEMLAERFATFERETFAAGVEAAAKCAEGFSRFNDQQANHFGDGPRMIADAIRSGAYRSETNAE